MPFQNKYGKRKVKPNRLKDHPVVSFNAKLSVGATEYLKKMQAQKKGSEFVCNSIESHYNHLTNPLGYWKQIIELNFGTIRHLLRKIGRERADNNIHNNK